MKRKPGSRRWFSLRLRPRLRLLFYRLKRFSALRLIEDAITTLHRNTKKFTLFAWFSVALGMCFLFLRFTAQPASIDVPYSEFVANLQSGSVSAVQFEDDSRYIYFSKHSDPQESSESIEDSALAVNALNVGASGSPKSITNERERGSSSTPKWQYFTRKVDHDESYLLGLMREKGTTYSSAPQSALKLLRSLVITLITLWIPLAPMMWLLYRQFYASNSPAKKRRPSNQSVCFDDVEGVDAAKLELMEVNSTLSLSLPKISLYGVKIDI